MLEAVSLTKRYHSIPAVQNVSIHIRRGQILLESLECLFILRGLMPVLLFTAPIRVLAGSWGVALVYLALVAVLMLLMIEMRLREWHKIPFTCSQVPDRRNFWQAPGGA